MFTPPPRPPKDYIIKDVPFTQLSAQEHTPDALPRVTQTNFAKYCSPVERDEHDNSGEVHIETVRPQVLDRWTRAWRAYWVDKPGYNAYNLHNMFKKYTVVVDSSYDPRFKNKRE